MDGGGLRVFRPVGWQVPFPATACDENVAWWRASEGGKIEPVGSFNLSRGAFLMAGVATAFAAPITGKSPDDPSAVYEEARTMIGQDNKKAFELMHRAADAGSADATGGLGYFYAQGIEVPKDERKAAEYFMKGAKGGSARSQLNYAAVLLAGQGVQQNPAEAARWLEKAAEGGVPEAQERLGLSFLHGDLLHGVDRNQERARQLLASAADAGLPASQNAYAHMLANALGGAGDEQAAEQWYRRAAEQGDRKGMSNLGRMLHHAGTQHRERRVEGLKWLLAAEALEEVTARNALAEYKVNADGWEWEQAQKEADRLLSSLRSRAETETHPSDHSLDR